jgi:dTDP-4-amino-4,6-dideoxygalactose transaminase
VLVKPVQPTLAIDGGPRAVALEYPGSLHGVLEIGEEEIDAVTNVLRRKTMFRFLNSPEVSETGQLEAAFRQRLGVNHALAVGGGGTAALICALIGLGIGSGDEVIVPGYTYIATAAACLVVGAIPILAEIDDSLTLDPRDVERKITPFTRAIIPVHMRGFICDMNAINAIARKQNLKVLEDCAQANGGTYQGKPVGSIGDAGAFSMQHYKIITAGEGGIVATRHPHVYRRAATRHDSALVFWEKAGAESSDWESFAGDNSRMDDMRAALALTQLARMDAILSHTRATKARLVEATAAMSGIFPHKQNDAAGDLGITFVFFLDTPDRAKRFSTALAAEGLPNQTIYNRQIPDRHIYNRWDYVMNKTTHDHTGWPWTSAHRPIEYAQDMLPQTLDVLSRCIAISINQRWTDAYTDQAIAAIAKVATAV